MTNLTDETLVAFADGQLDEAVAEEIRLRLRADPALRARVRRFEESAGLLAAAFAGYPSDATPAHLVGMVRAHGRRARRTLAGPWRVRSWTRAPVALSVPRLALAASLVLTAGVLLGVMADRWMGAGDGPVLAVLDGAEAWQRGLDVTPSGGTFPVSVTAQPAAREFEVAWTFVDTRERYCRAFTSREAGAGGRRLVRGIACRTPAGRWASEMIVLGGQGRDVPDPGTRSGDGYTPAAGVPADTLELLTEQMMAASPMPPERERELIRRAWR